MFLFIPLYLKYLGVEAYGVVSFYSMMSTLLLFADGGLSATLAREMAGSAPLLEKRSMLFSIERFFLPLCTFLAVVILAFSNSIVSNFLHADAVAPATLQRLVCIMGPCLALQLISMLYTSGLMGLQEQVWANSLNIIWSAMRTGLVLVPLSFSRSLEWYFWWQLGCNAIFVVVCHFALWRKLKHSQKPVFQLSKLGKIKRFALGSMGFAIGSGLLAQVDRAVVGYALPLEKYTVYAMAATLGQLPQLIAAPLTVALTPKAVSMAAGPMPEMTRLVNLAGYGLHTLLSCITAVMISFGSPLVGLWTNNDMLAGEVAPIASMLCLGNMLLATQTVPTIVATAFGHNRTNVIWTGLLLLIATPATIVLVHAVTLAFVPIAILTVGLITCLVLPLIIFKKWPVIQYQRWMLVNTFLPFALSAATAWVCVDFLLPLISMHWLLEVGVLLCSLAVVHAGFQYKALRDLFRSVALKSKWQ